MKNAKGLLLLSFVFLFNLYASGQTTKGYIVSIEKGQVYVDLTSTQVQAGSILNVLVKGGYITHPVTGRRIRKEDEVLAVLEVGSTFKEYSVARPFKTEQIQKLKVGMEVQITTSSKAVTDTKRVTSNTIASNNVVQTTKSDQVTRSKPNVTSSNNPRLEKAATTPLKPAEKNSVQRNGMTDIVVEESISNPTKTYIPRKGNLKEICKKNARIYIISEIPDSIANYPYLKEFNKQFNENGFWRTANSAAEADMILCFRGYVLNNGSSIALQCYAIVFDNKFNFLYRTKSYYALGGYQDITEYNYTKSFCRKITQNIRTAKPKKETKTPKRFSQKEFELCYLKGTEAMQNYRYKEAKEHFSKCVKMDPTQWQLYKTIGFCCAELEDYKSTLKHFDSYLVNNPMDNELDYAYGVYEGIKIQKSIARSMRIAQIANIVSTTLNQAVNIYATANGIQQSNTPINTYTNLPTQTSNTNNSSRLTKQTCSNCKGTGVNPAATHSVSFAGTGEEYCEHCRKYVASGHGYHGTCPSCSGKGYIMKIK